MQSAVAIKRKGTFTPCGTEGRSKTVSKREKFSPIRAFVERGMDGYVYMYTYICMYMADIFNLLNEPNNSLRGLCTNTFIPRNKMDAFKKKLAF
jgi:hypothetical protein